MSIVPNREIGPEIFKYCRLIHMRWRKKRIIAMVNRRTFIWGGGFVEISIKNKELIYGGKEYDPGDIKVTISLKNRYKGKIAMVLFVLLNVFIFISIFGTPIHNVIFPTYFLPIFTMCFIGLSLLLFLILTRYYMDVAIVELEEGRTLGLLYTGNKKVLVEKIIGVAGSVDYKYL